jgi:uncharacterized membrane protein YcfT
MVIYTNHTTQSELLIGVDLALQQRLHTHTQTHCGVDCVQNAYCYFIVLILICEHESFEVENTL